MIDRAGIQSLVCSQEPSCLLLERKQERPAALRSWSVLTMKKEPAIKELIRRRLLELVVIGVSIPRLFLKQVPQK